jgi:hypothetical protein
VEEEEQVYQLPLALAGDMGLEEVLLVIRTTTAVTKQTELEQGVLLLLRIRLELVPLLPPAPTRQRLVSPLAAQPLPPTPLRFRLVPALTPSPTSPLHTKMLLQPA